jgi:ATP-dependent Clp protease ATP-binding subunit ClpA
MNENVIKVIKREVYKDLEENLDIEITDQVKKMVNDEVNEELAKYSSKESFSARPIIDFVSKKIEEQILS